MQKALSYCSVRDLLVELRTIHIQAAECCDQASYTPDQRPALLASLFRYQQEALDNHLSLPSGNVLDQAKTIQVPFVPIGQVNESLRLLKSVSRKNSEAIAAQSFLLQHAMVELLIKLSCSLYGTPASQILSDLAEDFTKNQEEVFGMVTTEIQDE